MGVILPPFYNEYKQLQAIYKVHLRKKEKTLHPQPYKGFSPLTQLQGKPVVMQVLPRFQSGGVEWSTVDIVNFLATLDDSSTYVVSAGGEMVSELDNTRTRHINLFLATQNPFKIILNAFHLARHAKNFKIDLFHVHSRAPAWSVLIASKLTGIPYVATYHGAYGNGGIFKNFYNSVMIRGSYVIAISDFISRVIQRDHKSPKIAKIYQGIDENRFNPDLFSDQDREHQRLEWGIPYDAPLILAIGRMVPGKRYDLAIKSLENLDRQDAHLVIVGPDSRGKLTSVLKGIAESLGVEKRVHFVPNCKNIPLAYAASDVVVFPTMKNETFGRISAEAGAMEKIVIASKIGAISEVVVDGQTGFLFPPGDLEALVQNLNLVLDMPLKERRVLEQRARAHINKNFSAQKMYQQTLNLYEEIVFSG